MTTTQPTDPLYQEIVSRKPVFVWPLVVFLAALALTAFVVQILAGVPFGPNPAPDWVIILVMAICTVAMPIFVRSLRLKITVTDTQLIVQYRPLYTWSFDRVQIESAEAFTCRPMREFLGWGIRYTPWAGWALSISGNRGVQLQLTSGRRIFIGSARSEELAQALAPELTSAKNPGD